MNLIKYIILISIVLVFSACEKSPFLYEQKEGQITLYKPMTPTVLEMIALQNTKPNYYNDQCTKFSHTVELDDTNYGNLYIDSVVLNNNCSFQGQERGLFEYFLKFRSKLKSMELVQREEVPHYEFSKYLIDGEYQVNLIYIWEAKRATFILDYKGVLSNSLMKKLDIATEFELNTTSKNINPKLSMVRDNHIHEFWTAR